jgi:hypothetical protein
MSGELVVDIVRAMMVGPGTKPVRTFPSGRTCDEPGCRVRLSIYNASSSCGLHSHFEAVAHVAWPARRRTSRGFEASGASRVAA